MPALLSGELYKLAVDGRAVSDRILGLEAAERAAAALVRGQARAVYGQAQTPVVEVFSESHGDVVSRVAFVGGPFASVRVDRSPHA